MTATYDVSGTQYAELHAFCGRGPFLAAAAADVIARDPERYYEVKIDGRWRSFGDAKQLRLAIESDTGQKAGRGPRPLGKLVQPTRTTTARDAALAWTDYREHVLTVAVNHATDPETYAGAAAELERAIKHLRAAAGKRSADAADAFLARVASAVEAAERVNPDHPGRAPAAYEYVDRDVYKRSAASHDAALTAWQDARERVRCAARAELVEPDAALAEYVQRTAAAADAAQASLAEAAAELRAAESARAAAESKLERASVAGEVTALRARSLHAAVRKSGAAVTARTGIHAQRTEALARAQRIAARAAADSAAWHAGAGFLRGDAAADAAAEARAAWSAAVPAEPVEAAEPQPEPVEAAEPQPEPEPEHQEQPAEPEHQEQPAEPEHQEQPAEPEHQEQPAEPEHQEQPAEPEHQEQPAEPEHQEQPAEPEHQEQPAEPEHQEQPAEPEPLEAVASAKRAADPAPAPEPGRALAGAIARAALAAAPVVVPALVAALARRRARRRYVHAGIEAAEAVANESVRS